MPIAAEKPGSWQNFHLNIGLFHRNISIYLVLAPADGGILRGVTSMYQKNLVVIRLLQPKSQLLGQKASCIFIFPLIAVTC